MNTYEYIPIKKKRIFTLIEFLETISEVNPAIVLDFLIYYEGKTSNIRLKPNSHNLSNPLDSEVLVPIFDVRDDRTESWGIISIRDYISYFNRNYIPEDNFPIAKKILQNRCNITNDEWAAIELKFKI